MFVFKRFFSLLVSICFSFTCLALPITPIHRGVIANTVHPSTNTEASPSVVDDTGIIIRPITNPVKGDPGQGSGIGINPPPPKGEIPKPPPPTPYNPYVPIPITQPLMGGLSCPLTDTRMTTDVLTSIENLQRTV